jgi:ABC-2 type transport system permease protein
MSYRTDFWLNFLGRGGSMFLASYFVWEAVYQSRGVVTINGYSFSMMVFYSALAPMINRVAIGSEFVGIQLDIFSGSLNRYLIFPVPYGLVKYLGFLAQGILAMGQCIMVWLVIWWIGGSDMGELVHGDRFLGALAAAFAGNILYFFLAGILEMVSFWHDQVWNLIVMLRFLIYFASGLAIPLEFYPPWAAELLLKSPFPFLAGIPMQIALGDPKGWLSMELIAVYLGWFAALLAGFILVWNCGKKQYSGVGQ